MKRHVLSELSWNGRSIRVCQLGDTVWLMGIDVCTCLGLRNPHDALSRLGEDEKQMFNGFVDRLGRKKGVIIINEPGIYRLVLSARCPGAEKFKHWLCHDVLPSLRTTGRYDLTVADNAPILRVDEMFPTVKQMFPVVVEQELPFFKKVAS